MTAPMWTAPTVHEARVMVRDLIVENPERHRQESWVWNVFTSVDDLMNERTLFVDDIQPYATVAMPGEPLDDEYPVCGTTACVAGWGGVLGAPPGTWIGNAQYPSLYYPDGSDESIAVAGQRVLGLTSGQAGWLFASERSRTEVVRALTDLIDHPSKTWVEMSWADDDEDPE